MSEQTDQAQQAIRDRIVQYVLENHISPYDSETLPLNQSLYELGVLDSIGVVELIVFMEDNWAIIIEDSEITSEKMGSINKIVTLIHEKTADRAQ